MQQKKPHFKILGTGSSGNAYLLNNNLLLDAGISFEKIRKASDFTITPTLITHEHQDHSLSIKPLLKIGTPIYMTKGTQEALDIKDYNITNLEENKTIQIGQYQITPFKSYHDAKEPVNYQITYEDKKILYITDTREIPYTFKKVTHLLLEINYTVETIIEKLTETPKHPYYSRVIQTHLSDYTAIKWLTELDKSKLEEVYIVHTSENNCNIDQVKKQLAKLKIPYKIAKEELWTST